jgi:PAS domain S-box-containing protein
MKLFHNLQTRILVFLLSTILLVLIAIGMFVGVRNHNFAVDRVHEYTQLIADKNAKQVQGVFNEIIGMAKANADLLSVQLNSHTLSEEQIAEYLKVQLSKNKQFQSVWLILDAISWDAEASANQWVLFEVSLESNKQLKSTFYDKSSDALDMCIANASDLTISEPYKKAGVLVANLTNPIFSNTQIKGYVGATINLSFLNNFVKESPVFEGGFITVMSHNTQFVGHTNNDFLGKTFDENFSDEDNLHHVVQQMMLGKSFEISTSFKHKTYYSYFVPFKVDATQNKWMVEVTVPMHEILESSKSTIRNSIMVAIVGLIILIIVVWQVTKMVIGPIRQVTSILDMLSVGNTHNISEMHNQGISELKQMSDSLQKVVSGLRKTEKFALEIGQGNLNADFHVLGAEDQLGKALLDMRGSLQHSSEEDKKRKKEEEIRSWATQGIAKFGEILRQDSNNMKNLGFNFISNLVNYLDVNQGAMFVLNDEVEEDVFFELNTAIAYGRDKFLNKEIRIGEGLVGRCAFEKKTIYLKELPNDYMNITSGLGTANPSCVLIVPCILNDEVFGIIEIASFRDLKPHEIEFVEKLGESVASTISNVKVNEKTNRLLSASQNQSEELAAQEEELRQNLEEMEATQEDLKRQMETNAKMRETMLQQTALLDALLNSLPDYIYFKDKDSKFLKISKSMLGLFGAKTVEDVIGKSDFDYHTPENAQNYFNDEKQIMREQKGITDQLQREIKHDGSVIWTSVTKLPLITEQGNVIGTFGISKNVTDLKNLEIAAQKRNDEMQENMEAMQLTQQDLEEQMETNSKMRENLMQQTTLLDALLNYLPDYIYFKDADSKFLRISKSMIALFGAKSDEEVIGKSDFDFQTVENAKKYYNDEQNIIQSKKGITNQLQREIMPDGTELWNSVTKLPLLTNEGQCIGTFGISKDVTELKKLELESHEREVELNGIITAIQNSTFTVEYDQNGTITDVNEALLNLFGIQRKDIIGTHHRDGIDMKGKSKKDYDAFWKSLKQGQILKLQTKFMIHKKEVYLSETYTPIKDVEGNVVKILKIAFDITEYLKKGNK